MIVMRLLAAAALLPLMMSFAAAQSSGDITVSEVWSRATPGGARNGVAFLQISASATGDKLIDAKSDVSERVELHNHIHEDGVMRMRRVDAIEVPAGQTVTLEPSGYHLMLMDLKQPLEHGESLDLTLVFEKAGEIEVTASVEPIGSRGPGATGDGHDHDHDHHDHDHESGEQNH